MRKAFFVEPRYKLLVEFFFLSQSSSSVRRNLGVHEKVNGLLCHVLCAKVQERDAKDFRFFERVSAVLISELRALHAVERIRAIRLIREAWSRESVSVVGGPERRRNKN